MGFTQQDYVAAFEAEEKRQYRDIDYYEARTGYAVNRMQLLPAAAILACPIKDHEMPLWQHGRVLYSTLRRYLADHQGNTVITCVDIGTAKGFSALCMVWAITESASKGEVWSVDVLDPFARIPRNTVAECEGFVTLAQVLVPWPETSLIKFRHQTSAEFFLDWNRRTHFAFLDGKHSNETVLAELHALRRLQMPGDIVICDDYQMPQVAMAVGEVRRDYEFEIIAPSEKRKYAIGTRL